MLTIEQCSAVVFCVIEVKLLAFSWLSIRIGWNPFCQLSPDTIYKENSGLDKPVNMFSGLMLQCVSDECSHLWT